jgi:hypothetical protein
MAEPCVSARYMAQFLAHVDKLPSADRDAVLAAIGAERAAKLRGSASFFTWLPVEDNLVATRAVASALGARRTHEFFASLQEASLALPVFSWVVSVAALARGNPVRVLRWVAKGYGLMFRDAGQWEVVDAQATSATLRLVGTPAEMLRDGTWLASVSSSLHAIFAVASVEGAVTPAGIDVAEGAASFRFRWVEHEPT